MPGSPIDRGADPWIPNARCRAGRPLARPSSHVRAVRSSSLPSTVRPTTSHSSATTSSAGRSSSLIVQPIIERTSAARPGGSASIRSYAWATMWRRASRARTRSGQSGPSAITEPRFRTDRASDPACASTRRAASSSQYP